LWRWQQLLPDNSSSNKGKSIPQSNSPVLDTSSSLAALLQARVKTIKTDSRPILSNQTTSETPKELPSNLEVLVAAASAVLVLSRIITVISSRVNLSSRINGRTL